MLLNQGLFNQNHAQLLYRSITDVFITHIFQWKQLIAFFAIYSINFVKTNAGQFKEITSVNGEQLFFGSVLYFPKAKIFLSQRTMLPTGN